MLRENLGFGKPREQNHNINLAGTNKRSLLVKVTYKRKSVKIRVVLQRIQRHPHAKKK
jgi:hypothetical protein